MTIKGITDYHSHHTSAREISLDRGGGIGYTVLDGKQSSDSEPSASLMCGTGVTPLEVALVQSKMHPVRICNGRKQGLLVGEFFYARKNTD